MTEVDSEELRKELATVADAVFDEHERVVPPLNKQIWKIDREIRKILLDQVLLYELEIQEASADTGVVPEYFELAFGGPRSAARDPSSKPEPLEITRTNSAGRQESLKISGQIDRVDVARDKTLIAYDYKLSSGASLDDIKSGRSLQLPIYLEALEKLLLTDHRIAGGGYYVIRGGGERRNRGLHRAAALDYSGIGARTGGVMSDESGNRFAPMLSRRFGIFSITCAPATSSSTLPRRKRLAGFVISRRCAATIAIASTGRNESADYADYTD